MAPGAQPEIFQGRGGFVKLGHFNKHFVKNTRKKGAAGKIFGVYQCLFFQNQGTFFDFQKWQEGPSPLPTSGALGSFWILCAETATRGVLLNKVLPTTLSKKRLCHTCFPVNFANFLKTPF